MIITAQNAFQQGRTSVSVMRNYSDFVLFDSMQQRQSLDRLGRMLFPGQGRLLGQAMSWLRSHLPDRPDQRYVWVDAHPASVMPDYLRVRSRLVPYADDDDDGGGRAGGDDDDLSDDGCPPDRGGDDSDWFQIVFSPPAHATA